MLPGAGCRNAACGGSGVTDQVSIERGRLAEGRSSVGGRSAPRATDAGIGNGWRPSLPMC
ncbi:hypothetical protein C6Q22_01615 [Burkholderia multivorans]|nr:hypothetical protein C6Q22_01615 [Burkholderia multivorans]PRG61179.1 hypothetical protein C6T69_27025 [Burkholderia multivorans]PRG96449.1 hypothetical protein C6V04_05355 [Burkholderia multivorans]